MKCKVPDAFYQRWLIGATSFWLALSLAACGVNSPTSAPQTVPIVPPAAQLTATPKPNLIPGIPQDEDDIKEVILRYHFEKTSADFAKESVFPWKYYCLGIGTTMNGVSTLQDPPQSLLDRFKGTNPPVVKASDCAMVEDKVFEKKAALKGTGEPARFWAVSAVTWLSGTTAELEASHQGNFGDAGGQVFQLERENGNWKITGSTSTWIA